VNAEHLFRFQITERVADVDVSLINLDPFRNGAIFLARATMLALLLTANLLIPLAVIIFASGFFPYKPSIQGLASHDDFRTEHGEPPKAQFDKLVFMVVDALRSDFVFSSGSGFSYTQKYTFQISQ
jgi:hypothetical protein